MTTATDTSFKVDGVTYKLDKALNETPVMQFTANNNTKYEAETLYAVAGGDTVKYDAQTFTAVDKGGNGKIDFFSVAPLPGAEGELRQQDRVPSFQQHEVHH